MNEYEAERARRIADNMAKMQQLGLVEASRALAAASGGSGISLQRGCEQGPPRKKRKAPAKVEAAHLASRVSRRLKGEAAPPAAAAGIAARAAARRAEADDEGAAPLGRTTKGSARRALELTGAKYAAPFTLRYTGTTVWELGEVYRGVWAQRYWSSAGCLFHHAYPVGYRATKVAFGRSYEMRIEAGPTGPVFKVVDVRSGATFSGASPTKPWTDVCIAHRTGQRISGPLYFGFSEAITQRAIATELYGERELAAALAGERPAAAGDLAPEEQAALEFAGLDGVGEATAVALARTAALGGRRHGSVAALRAWAAEAEAHAAQLESFLLSSSELPEAQRRWPAWRQRIVPRILAALGCGPEPRAGPAAAAGAEAEAAAAGDAAAGDATAPGPAPARKENRAREANARPAKAANPAAPPKPAVHAAAARTSARRRQASSRYSGFELHSA